MATGPHDDGNSEVKDEDDALAVPSFGGPALVAGTSGGDAWWDSVDTARTTEWVPDNDVVAGFGEGEVPGFGNGWAGSEAEAEVGVGSWLIVGVIRMAHRCRLPLWWTAKSRMADRKLMIGPICGMGPVGPWRCREWAWLAVDWPKWSPQGWMLLTLDTLDLFSLSRPSIPFLSFFLRHEFAEKL